MAKAIAHITGTALRPGVSRNKRWYKPEHIAGMVTSAQQRIGEGRKPMVMLSFHGAEDNSREITAALTSMTLEDDGAAGFTADIIGTEAGRDIATLADSTDGKPALSTVSIRGAWTGRVRKERGPDGQMVETADGLELDGVDFTKSPGVEGAEIKTFSWATGDQRETQERVLITESVEEPVVTISEGVTHEGPAATVPEGFRETMRAVLGLTGTHVLENGLCVTCGGVGEANKKPYGDVIYADNGYQKDGVKRYPLDSPAHVRSAWSYINMPKNAAKYSSDQLKRIKGRIKAAMKRIGAKVSGESYSGFTAAEPYQVSEAVAEWYGSPESSGSYCLNASNGPTSVSVSGYGLDPADLRAILAGACKGASLALAALDPDMDGDIDLPGAPGADTDHDGGHETAPEDTPATETHEPVPAGNQDPAPAGPQEGDPAMAEETSTNGTGGATQNPGLSGDALAKIIAESTATAVTAAFEAREAAKAEAKRAAKEAEDRAAEEERKQREALAGILEKMGIKVPAATETTETPAAEGATGGAAVTETVEQQVERRVGEALVEFKQQLISSGAILPSRAGIIVSEHSVPSEDDPSSPEDLAKIGDDEFMNGLGAAMAHQADLIRPVGAPQG